MKTSRHWIRASILCVALALAGSAAIGQSYGPETQRLTIGAGEFKAFDLEPYFGPDGYVSLPDDGPRSPLPYFLAASVQLPEGAMIDEICLWANDTNDFFDVSAELVVAKLTPAGEQSDLKLLGSVMSYLYVGYWSFCADVGAIFRGRIDVDEDGVLDDAAYYVRAGLYSRRDSSVLSLGAVQIAWRRQVSDPPGTPTFADVPPSHLFYQFIEALAASGITAGCGPGKFCPDKPLTRGQMAVFLAKALGLHWPN